MISLVITSFNEPKTIGTAIEAALNQTTSQEYEVIVSAPDKETLLVAKQYGVKTFQDPGKGKSFALNLLFQKLKSDILVLTDGDVKISDCSIEEIARLFDDKTIGCVTGKPVPAEDRSTKFGYWANFLFEAAHNLRKNLFEKGSFLECSGYLFAFRREYIKEIPLDVAEDAIIPYFFQQNGLRIGYADKAEVYVKNVTNFADWIKQKVRSAKAHETLGKYVDVHSIKRIKSFKNELKGIKMLFVYPSNFKEFVWTLELILARGYMWFRVFWDTKIANKNFGDAWERIESTK